MKLFGIVALKKRIVSRETISRISFPLLHNEQYPPHDRNHLTRVFRSVDAYDH